MLHSALPPCSKVCRPAIFCDFLAPNFVAGADWCVLVHCCVCAVSWCSNGTMQCLCCVSGCCRGRGCKEGAGGTLPPAVLVRKFVSGCAVRAEVRLWAGSQPLGSLALARDLGGDIDKTRTKRTCATQSALKHLKCDTLAGALPIGISGSAINGINQAP